MKIYKILDYKGAKITIKESESIKGYQFKCLVNSISLGCLPTKEAAEKEAITFINKLK